MIMRERKRLIQSAAKLDKNFQVFGSSNHHYMVSDPVSKEEILNFEAIYNITLPKEYADHLMEIGTGAGPFFGLYTFEQVKKELPINFSQCTTHPHAITPQLTKTRWIELTTQLEELGEGSSQYDQFICEMTCHLLTIATQGCTCFIALYLEGEHAGEVVYLDTNYEDYCMPFFSGMTFSEWFDGYFQEIILGNNLDSYGCLPLHSQLKLRNNFEGAEDKEKWLGSFFRFLSLEKESISFLMEQVISGNHALAITALSVIIKKEPAFGLDVLKRAMLQKQHALVSGVIGYIPNEKRKEFHQLILELLAGCPKEYAKNLEKALQSSK